AVRDRGGAGSPGGRGEARAVARSSAVNAFTPDERTAYHEAGHAVVGLLVGLELGMVTIVPTDDALGVTRFSDRRLDEPGLEGDQEQEFVEQHVMTELAGVEAEKRLTGQDQADPVGPGSVGELALGASARPDDYLAAMRSRTADLLNEWWPAVVAVAAALL